MGDWILNQFMALFNSVLGWITQSLGGFFGGLVEILLEALIDGAKKTLSDIVHALLGGLVNEVTQGINAVAWIPEWVKYGLTTFAGNVGEALGTIADGAITMVAEGSMEILGVTNAQEQYMSQLQLSLLTTTTALMDRIEAAQTTTIQVEEAAIDIIYDYVDQTVVNATVEVEEFLRLSENISIIHLEDFINSARIQERAAQQAIEESERVARELAEKDLMGASLFIEEMALKYPERYMNDLKDTILIPAANAEALYWAFSESLKIDPEDVVKQLEIQFVAMLRLAAKMGSDPAALEIHKEPFQ